MGDFQSCSIAISTWYTWLMERIMYWEASHELKIWVFHWLVIRIKKTFISFGFQYPDPSKNITIITTSQDWEYTEINFVENFLIHIYFITTNYYGEALFSQRAFNLKKQETIKINLWPKMCSYEILISSPTLGKIVSTVILSGDHYYNNNYIFCTNHFCSGSYGISITWNIS